MNRSILVGACLLLSLGAKGSLGQEAVLAELYGQGVHAFFAQDLRTAHELLTSAIEQGSRDPRSYYFRGLTYSQLGRPDEAEADFKAGAALEAGTADRVYPVADSLQRVQGRSRMQIEKHRQLARLASHSKASQIQRARYEQMKRAEENVLRAPAGSAAPAAAAPAAAAPAPGAEAPPADASDPFASGADMAPEPAPERPTEAPAAPAPAAADPFGAPAAEAPPAADATTNPFADDAPAAPAAPATPAPAADADDPFK